MTAVQAHRAQGQGVQQVGTGAFRIVLSSYLLVFSFSFPECLPRFGLNTALSFPPLTTQV